MFNKLSIETSSYCNRRCASCLRQTEPDRQAVASRQRQAYMCSDMVVSLLDQAKGMGFGGVVVLSFYNEPLLDSRLWWFGRHAMTLGFSRVEVVTNADYLDAKAAEKLDGCFDEIRVSLYEKTRERMDALRGMFTKTALRFTSGLHRFTHYAADASEQIAEVADEPCHHVGNNMIVNHCGDVLACCDEIIPHFDLGNVHEATLQELWVRKRELVRTLKQREGRRTYPYCLSCPRYYGAKARYEVVSA